MTRVRIKIEYDGTCYGGWQRQKNAPSIQQTLEETLGRLLEQKITLVGAGRTDAGVHARGQVAHFDANMIVPPDKLFLAANTMLPPDIRLAASEEAEPDFHARFGALGKRYLYTICNANYAPAIARAYCAFVPAHLDEVKMQDAAQLFVGTHDFKCAMAAGGQVRSTVRTLYEISVTRKGEWITISVYGNGFLYNMVRILAGTFIRAGMDRISIEQIAQALQRSDRTLMGFTAPPQGLVLDEVFYAGNVFGKNGENRLLTLNSC